MLYGAIIGDIAGSRFEFHNIKGKDKSFDLLHPQCFFTDDTVMTCAIAKALMDSKGNPDRLADHAAVAMQRLGRAYPHAGYGRKFERWIWADEKNRRPYNSCGNGSAMRVSAVGYAAKNFDDVLRLSEAVTGVTHNHPEGYKGAEAAAACVWMALNGYSKDNIRTKVQEMWYPIDFTLDDIHDEYKFSELAQDTVPQAIEAFLESTSYEDALRLAITLGGDSDTLAAITGGIAGAYYGVPTELRRMSRSYLTEDLIDLINDFTNWVVEKDRG